MKSARKAVKTKINEIISRLTEVKDMIDTWNPNSDDSLIVEELSVVNDDVLELIESFDNQEFDFEPEDDVEDDDPVEDEEDEDDVKELDAELSFDEEDEDEDE